MTFRQSQPITARHRDHWMLSGLWPCVLYINARGKCRANVFMYLWSVIDGQIYHSWILSILVRFYQNHRLPKIQYWTYASSTVNTDRSYPFHPHIFRMFCVWEGREDDRGWTAGRCWAESYAHLAMWAFESLLSTVLSLPHTTLR